MQGTGRDYVRTTPRRPRRGECFRLFSCRFGRNDMFDFILVLFMGSLEDMPRVLLRQVGSACWCCERNYSSSTWFHGGGLIDALVIGKGSNSNGRGTPQPSHVRFYNRKDQMADDELGQGNFGGGNDQIEVSLAEAKTESTEPSFSRGRYCPRAASRNVPQCAKGRSKDCSRLDSRLL